MNLTQSQLGRRLVLVVMMLLGCSHQAVKNGNEKRAKLGEDVVQDAVIFEAGTKEGAVVPEISAPRLRAVIVEEKIEGNRLIERHREWIMEGEVQLLGIPKGPHSGLQGKPNRGVSHEN